MWIVTPIPLKTGAPDGYDVPSSSTMIGDMTIRNVSRLTQQSTSAQSQSLGAISNDVRIASQFDLFADRTSTRSLAANQLRLWFASTAYVLANSVRRLALLKTDLADATCGAIRRKLSKIGALVTISVRRIKLAMASPTRASLPRRIGPSVVSSTPT